MTAPINSKQFFLLTLLALSLIGGSVGFYRQLKGQAQSKVHQYRKKHLNVRVTEIEGVSRMEVCNLDSVPLLSLKVRFKSGTELATPIGPLAPSLCTEIELSSDLSRPVVLESWAAQWESETEEYLSQWVSF